MQQTVLKISGMTCAHCVSGVTKALKDVPGVTDAQVSLKDEKATVWGEVNPTALVTAVQEEGYSAEVQRSAPDTA